MPIYDCGAPDCEECQRAFGPDRRKAIASYEARARLYASTADALGARHQAASGGGGNTEKVPELAASNLAN